MDRILAGILLVLFVTPILILDAALLLFAPEGKVLGAFFFVVSAGIWSMSGWVWRGEPKSRVRGSSE